MQHKPLIILSLALTFLISFDYLAAWTVPPSNPPSGNIAAPLNTASTAQTKPGLLGVSQLIANTAFINRADAPNGAALAVSGNVAASAYCDGNGENCISLTDIGVVSSDVVEGATYVGSNTVINLVPGQKYLAFFYGNAKDRAGGRIESCSGNILITTGNVGHTGRNATESHLLPFTAPVDGCIRAFVRGTSRSPARYITLLGG